MNKVLKQIKARRSCRAFLEKDIPKKVKDAIIDAALQAPTAGNMTLYSIIDVTDKALKERLSVTCDNQPFIAKAPMVLVFCADYHRWYGLFCRNCDTVRAPDEGDLSLANADALIAAQNTVLAAESFGVGSCYIGDITENFEEHRALFSLPDHVVPTCMLCFGYPTKGQKNRKKPPRFKAEDIVFSNRYDDARAMDMERMLCEREQFADSVEDWTRRFCERKWNSDFSKEMSRSCREMRRAFTKTEE